MKTLTAEDRCDRCGAQGYLQVGLAGAGELTFCGHHAEDNRGAIQGLLAGGWLVLADQLADVSRRPLAPAPSGAI